MDSLLINPFLAYVKAFQLRGDSDSLKHAALGKFAPAILAEAKRILWDKCSLSSLGLPLTSRRTTEKRSQAAADLDDILAAFAKLDDKGSIPMIFCEASDLVLLPPIVTDPVCEMVHENSRSLRGKVEEVSLTFLPSLMQVLLVLPLGLLKLEPPPLLVATQCLLMPLAVIN